MEKSWAGGVAAGCRIKRNRAKITCIDSIFVYNHLKSVGLFSPPKGTFLGGFLVMAISIIAISIQATHPIACFRQLLKLNLRGSEYFDWVIVASLALSIAMYEWLELGIEHSVEHLFHTSRHGSQIGTIYILMPIAVSLLSWLYRLLPRLCRQFRHFARQVWEHRKTECRIYCLSLPLINKLKLISTAGVFFPASYFAM